MIHYFIWILTASLYTPLFFVLYRHGWKSSDYTHAYFIIPVFFWLVWRKRALLRESIQKSTPGNNFFGLSILLLGIFLFTFGWRQDYRFLTALSLLPVLYGLVSYLYGLKVTKILSFPILYLILLAPIPTGIIDSVTLPMRYGLSVATETILKLFHYPITREGLLLTIGKTDLFMGQPCSGFRSIVTMFSLALIYAYINKGSISKKGVLVSSIIPLALVGNLIRIITLCLITYYFGEEAGQGFFHSMSGVVIFVFIILGLIGLEYLLERCRITR
ncbi:MAG: exosortase [Candidatus Brocadia sp.]|uniref:Membrane protein n=1 Tax=Candidatus Brocadia sinica JPN1 TaxID=1197129 RepID=A0ABQ0K2L5_9BACT|nr:exosortase/archaeosortase family protein [Candidatus Brocadia sinica]KAA0240937.1 MAG: exosortase/archaeosortase family protein [Candidatus Brocadia sp. AMX2]MBL1170778.1 exosortase/archaeosortase family protein [Candidatus Brocadia sp. AMX1]MCQ3919005.1 exosortase [Candidatus Brocadia sp.]NOG43101.1 exosortase/archaeosortase family protein [Planctomycetota bacterium]KXK31252.1 MAG: putative exosortase [Candidatus Brocadia sinica]